MNRLLNAVTDRCSLCPSQRHLLEILGPVAVSNRPPFDYSFRGDNDHRPFIDRHGSILTIFTSQ